MPNHYFATFVTGCQDIIGTAMRRYPRSELIVNELHDGLVVFESTLTENQLSEVRYLNNVYKLLADGTEADLPAPALPAPGTFIVRVREGSQPTTVPPELNVRVAAQTGLKTSAHNPDHSFLLWRRTDGRVLWGLALLRAGFKKRTLEAGELRPELAHILGLVAGLDAKDTVLDPFAGYGAIARECLQGFHCQMVIAVEHNEHLIPHLKAIPRLVALHGDAGELAHIDTRGIDRVITDPPWGDFAKATPEELHHLYKGALLTSVPFMADLAAECAFDVVKEYPILVSGRKATIYKLRKLG
jgi:hypothetical protein